jgi:carbonic anhydrase
MEANLASAHESPQNGIAGLKYWKHDLLAGLLVSLVSLPLSTGIAIASGAPPITGLISAIIAGLLLPILGGSFVTISGPAAGLAPALLAGMTLLAHGDKLQSFSVGYPLLLAVIFLVGCVQVVLSLLKTAKFSAIFPSTVVEAMLASIGLLIIVKQLPFVMGVKAPGENLAHDFHSKEFFEYLVEAPSKLPYINGKVFGLTLFCLALIFLLGAIKAKWAKVIPPQLVAVVVGALLGWMMGFSGSAELIQIPANPFQALRFPNFAGLFGDSSLLRPALIVLVTLTLIDGVESLATASAIDRIDPWRRKSDPNRVLLAMGISNICSSVVGGLTIIPGGVKSKACIEAGGRTLWTNFYNAVFLIIYLLIATPLITRIPYAALAAVLIHTGYKLCRPSIWKHMAHLGREQIALFGLTVLVTLLTDLLWGIVFGVVLKLLVGIFLVSKSVQGTGLLVSADGQSTRSARGTRTSDLFRNPVSKTELAADGTYRLDFTRPMVCFNSIQVSDALAKVPDEATRVILHLTEGVTLIDHTSCDILLQFAADFEKSGRGKVAIEGLDRMCTGSHDQSCLKLSPWALDASHPTKLSNLARFGLGISGKPKHTEPVLTERAYMEDELGNSD